MTAARFGRMVPGAIVLTAVIALGSACSSGGGSTPAGGGAVPAARPAGKSVAKSTRVNLPDPRAGAVAQAPAPNLPTRSPEFPPPGKTLEQLKLEGKVDILK